MAIWNLVRFYHAWEDKDFWGDNMVAGGTEGGSVVVNRVQSGGGAGAGECRKLSVK